jgi:hypothetical protein
MGSSMLGEEPRISGACDLHASIVSFAPDEVVVVVDPGQLLVGGLERSEPERGHPADGERAAAQ